MTYPEHETRPNDTALAAYWNRLAKKDPVNAPSYRDLKDWSGWSISYLHNHMTSLEAAGKLVHPLRKLPKRRGKS